MTNERELKGVWAVLREIKDDFKHFDDKWEDHIKDAAGDRAQLGYLCQQMDNIEKLLTRGNGQKSVLVQLEGLHTDVETLKDGHKALRAANGIEDHSPEEARAYATKAKWVAIAKIAGLVTLTLPGILALLGAGG
jgi:hypothetical protein